MKRITTITGRANRHCFALAALAALTFVGTALPRVAVAGPLQDAEPKAVQTLLEASRSDEALLRMHAIEGAKSMPDRALPMVQLALNDPNPAVRFAALVTTGRLQLDSLGARALRLADDPDQPTYVQAAALFAADRCGQEADLGRLASMLWSADTALRSNAALLFGLSEDPSAVPVLLDAAEAPMQRSEPVDRELVRLQITEALLQLGHEPSLKAMRGAAYSNHDEVRILAVLMLGKAGDGGMRGNLTGFLAKDPAEFRLAAAESLARLGSAEGLPVMLDASVNEAYPTLRSQSAFALAQVSWDPRAVKHLLNLLDDPEPMVRIAAAAATLEAINPPANRPH